MLNMQTLQFVRDPWDRLGLSVPSVTCRACKRLYECETLLQLCALECKNCQDRRVHGPRPLQPEDLLW